MIMLVSLEQSLEERRTGRENELVSLNLLILASDCHVEKILVLPQLFESLTDVFLKVIPLETKLIPRAHGLALSSSLNMKNVLHHTALVNIYQEKSLF